MNETSYGDRTDSIQQKVKLFQKAYSSGNHDLAMSLVESMKDTLSMERQLKQDFEAPHIDADTFATVESLPDPCALWAEGWSFYKPLQLFETIGLGRSREPVDLVVSFRADQTTDLQREVRVARIDPDNNGALREIPSQIYGETRGGATRSCHLVFLAEVPVHGEATYLIFYGNAHAEQPEYVTDLHVKGEGYGLDVENEHFVARLSRQMGQIERLSYKRQQGLELFSGGKGHGDPPTIDWSHDYMAPGDYQKLRLRNWARCPNYDVVHGPVCTRIRRWGFPHSPLHPVFTPSRMHMDATYVFYSGLPYFFKEGSMEAVKDFGVERIRDDQWVFSGYSFTNIVWFDRSGKLHEGEIPGQHQEDLWGVGFYNDKSRDAFIALWLEHEVKNHGSNLHTGYPTLHYEGHGQVWARSPVAASETLETGATFKQRTAYLASYLPKEGGPGKSATQEVEALRHRLLNPLEVSSGGLIVQTKLTTSGRLARRGETSTTARLKGEIWKKLREVKDEQLYQMDTNIVDLGYVYDVRVRGGTVQVVVTMPHQGRPLHDYLVTEGGGRVEKGIQERLLEVKGVSEVVVELTWYPPWSVARMTDAGRKAVGLR